MCSITDLQNNRCLEIQSNKKAGTYFLQERNNRKNSIRKKIWSLMDTIYMRIKFNYFLTKKCEVTKLGSVRRERIGECYRKPIYYV